MLAWGECNCRLQKAIKCEWANTHTSEPTNACACELANAHTSECVSEQTSEHAKLQMHAQASAEMHTVDLNWLWVEKNSQR